MGALARWGEHSGWPIENIYKKLNRGILKHIALTPDLNESLEFFSREDYSMKG